jgi:hypothetical protein
VDPPTDEEVLRTLTAFDSGSVESETLKLSVKANNYRIKKESIADFIDPPRFFPLVGEAQVHHRRWKCTVCYSPVPVQTGKHVGGDETRYNETVVYIDHTHVHPLELKTPEKAESVPQPAKSIKPAPAAATEAVPQTKSNAQPEPPRPRRGFLRRNRG